jgi:hypothetical protein
MIPYCLSRLTVRVESEQLVHRQDQSPNESQSSELIE